jgi:Ammonium Transporter Family
MSKVDDTLSVFSTHGVAGLMGGLLTGVLANPDMLLYIGTEKDAPGINATGWYYGNFTQFKYQAIAALFIIVFNAIMTFVITQGHRDDRSAADGRENAGNRRYGRARGGGLSRIICARNAAFPPQSLRMNRREDIFDA